MSVTTSNGPDSAEAMASVVRKREARASASVTAGMSDAEFEAWLVAQGAVRMSEERHAAHLVRERVRQWAEAAAVMQEVRDEDIRNADTARAMRCFGGSVEALLPSHPPEPWSGLVTQQRWFAKLRKA
jgi:hypothetical protein